MFRTLAVSFLLLSLAAPVMAERVPTITYRNKHSGSSENNANTETVTLCRDKVAKRFSMVEVYKICGPPDFKQKEVDDGDSEDYWYYQEPDGSTTVLNFYLQELYGIKTE